MQKDNGKCKMTLMADVDDNFLFLLSFSFSLLERVYFVRGFDFGNGRMSSEFVMCEWMAVK